MIILSLRSKLGECRRYLTDKTNLNFFWELTLIYEKKACRELPGDTHGSFP